MDERVRTGVAISGGDTKDFPIKIGFHQGSTLSQFSFGIVIDELTKGMQGQVIMVYHIC